MSGLDDLPLPWNPNEPCSIDGKPVETRANLEEETDGVLFNRDLSLEEEKDATLFNRDCKNLDTSIPRRKDHFIECPDLPELPKVLLKNRQFNEVEFPGVPLAEIPKRLIAHLLSCCLEGRTAGFDFDIEQELDEENHKKELDASEALVTITIQLGSAGALTLGINLASESCFCDTTCGDIDFLKLKVNATAKYVPDEILEDPDLEITDDEIQDLIDKTGGGTNLYCGYKMPNTDLSPESLFSLKDGGSIVYWDHPNSFFRGKDASGSKSIYNPCGFPEDRPVIIGKVHGLYDSFTGYDETWPDGKVVNSMPGWTAIGCDTREFFWINKGSSARNVQASTSKDAIYYKGSVHYVKAEGSSGWAVSNRIDCRLAVCQRDFPQGWLHEYRMPFYPPEMNYGAVPDNDGSFVERCGVIPTETKFSNKRLDYHYANGRYAYEPKFVHSGKVSGTNNHVLLTIEGNAYEVKFPTPTSLTSYPDIYVGDTISVEVDARGIAPKLLAIEFPTDFAAGTIIASYTDLTQYRGWVEVTEDVYSSDIIHESSIVVLASSVSDVADFRIHKCTCKPCTCSHNSSSGGVGETSSDEEFNDSTIDDVDGSDTSNEQNNGSSTGHTCPHSRVSVSTASFRWFKKVKTGAIL